MIPHSGMTHLATSATKLIVGRANRAAELKARK